MSTHKVKTAVVSSILTAILTCTVCSPVHAGAWSGDSYKSWQQQDKSWSGMYLGSSGETVGQSGCAVTAAAMLMVKSGSVTDSDFSPAALVKFVNAWGGFGPTGNIDFNKLTRYAPSFIYCQKFTLSGTKAQKAEDMERLMAEGYYLLAVVKNGQHYVTIDSVDGATVTMMDPASQAANLFVHYAPAGVTELRLFRGANSRNDYMQEDKAATPPVPTISDTTPAAAPAEELTAPSYEELSPETPTFDELTPETPEEPDPETPPAPTEAVIAVPAVADNTATETKKNAAEPERETTASEDDPETPPMPEGDGESGEEAADPETPPMPADEPQETAILKTNLTFKLLMQVKLTAAKDLVLYAAPDAKAEPLLVIPAGGELEIVEADSQFLWGKAAYAGKTGWIDLTKAGL